MPTRVVEDQLREIVREYRHVQGEHARQSEDSSLRRKREAELKDLESQFEMTLARWLDDDALRAQWREHLFDACSMRSPSQSSRVRFHPCTKGARKLDRCSWFARTTRGNGNTSWTAR